MREKGTFCLFPSGAGVEEPDLEVSEGVNGGGAGELSIVVVVLEGG